jgi:hypothetical protein
MACCSAWIGTYPLTDVADGRNNVLAAGGVVSACLQPLPSGVMETNPLLPHAEAIKNYFDDFYDT